MECLLIEQDIGPEEGGEEEEGGGEHPFLAAAAAMLDSLDLNLTLATAKVRTGRHHHRGEGEATGRSRRRRGVFRALLCTERGPVLPPPTRYDAAPCRGYLLPARYCYVTGATEAPGKSLDTTKRSRGCGGGDAHKPDKYLQYNNDDNDIRCLSEQMEIMRRRRATPRWSNDLVW